LGKFFSGFENLITKCNFKALRSRIKHSKVLLKLIGWGFFLNLKFFLVPTYLFLAETLDAIERPALSYHSRPFRHQMISMHQMPFLLQQDRPQPTSQGIPLRIAKLLFSPHKFITGGNPGCN
jgi:hypothetical protein